MNKEFGKELARLRKEKNWTQSELADKLGVSMKQVSKWEQSVSVPSIDVISTMSKVFNIDIVELVDLIVIKKDVDFKKTKTESIAIIDLILLALGVAMGIGVFTLNVLGDLDINKAVSMLSIGLFSVSLYALSKIMRK